MRMGEFSEKMHFDVVSSGSIAIDLALGVGGFPRGRIVEIYGPESAVKPRSRCTPLPKRKKPAARRRSSTSNTRSIPTTRRHWASI